MDEFKNGQLKDALQNKIREVCLKIFIIQNQKNFESVSIKALQDQFQLKKPQIMKQVSKLIVKSTINAKLDMKTDSIVFESDKYTIVNEGQNSAMIGTLPTNDRSEVNYLQEQYLEKISHMIEANDRCLEQLVNSNTFIKR